MPLDLALASAPALTLLAACLSRPLTTALGRGAGWPLAGLYLVAAAALVPVVPDALDGHGATASVAWVPVRGWRLALHAEPIGLLFAMLALLVGAVVLIYSTAYLERTDDAGRPVRHHGFFQLMTLFTVSMLGLVLTDSLMMLFVCWELTSLASFALIACAGRKAYPAALRTLAITFAGGLVLLGAVVAVRVHTGTDSLQAALAHPVWHERPGLAAAVAVAVAVAGMTKSAQFPFHFWLPDAMAAATPVSAYLHAAAVVKAGIFLLLRFSPAFHDVPAWNALLVSTGLVTAAMGGLFALQKTDLKQLLAYSTVSQLGWIVACIGVGTRAALVAAALHTLAHALFKSGLFMLVGVVDHQAGTRDIRRLGRLWRVMPWTFGATCLGAAGMAGIPPLLGYVSKEAMLTALGQTPGGSWAPVLALVVACVGACLTVAYSARIVFGAFLDGPRDVGHVREAPVRLWLPAALPAAIGLPAALVVGVLDHPASALGDAASGTVGGAHQEHHEHLALWHGLTPELAMTAAILTVGALLMARRRRVGELLTGRELLPFTGATALEWLVTAQTRIGRRLVRPTDSDSPSRHLGAIVAVVVALAAAIAVVAAVTGATLPPRVPGQERPVDVVVLLVVVAVVLGMVAAPSRIAAVVLLSATGIAVTVQFFGLGAPDVGLTQLLVEAVTIVVFMLVLRRLPGTFIRPSPRRRRVATVLALASGLTATAAVWALTGRRQRSEVGLYLLDRGPELTGGDNVVNTVLVEFRALDTLGEVSVLGIAGLAVVAVLMSVRAPHRDPADAATTAVSLWVPEPSPDAAEALADTERNTAPLRLLSRVVTPVLSVVAVVLLWRGHSAPGGGFIAALVASCAVALIYLARPSDLPVSRRITPVLMIGGGLTTAVLTGVAGMAWGSFLTPVHGEVAHQHLSTALIFDIGVFAAVMGLVMIAINVLGTGRLRAYLSGAGAGEGAGDAAGAGADPGAQGSPAPEEATR